MEDNNAALLQANALNPDLVKVQFGNEVYNLANHTDLVRFQEAVNAQVVMSPNNEELARLQTAVNEQLLRSSQQEDQIKLGEIKFLQDRIQVLEEVILRMELKAFETGPPLKNRNSEEYRKTIAECPSQLDILKGSLNFPVAESQEPAPVTDQA